MAFLLLAACATNGIPGAGKHQPATALDGSTLDSLPRYISCVEPVYPPSLRVARVSGTVSLAFIVDSSGSVDSASVRVLSASDARFGAAAAASIRTCRFQPAMLDTQHVPARLKMSVSFSI